MDCIDMNGFSEVSVKLVRTSDSAVVWAYQIRKGASGPVAIRSLSEAIAKLRRSVFHVVDQEGSITVGKKGDLTVLSADPASDPLAFAKVRYAILGGKVIASAATTASGK
jgi:hypothetical protein